jgi:hypothetical protein
MDIAAIDLFAAVAIGIGATVAMDLWNLFLRRAFAIPSLSYCLLGRWISYMPEGRLAHASIGSATPKPRECMIGWIAHYSIGIGLAAGFVALASADWLVRPAVLPALLYGAVTVAFPYFIMQPSFGLGVAGSRTPHPGRTRLKSLATHLVFGLGLYVCAAAVSRLIALR